MAGRKQERPGCRRKKTEIISLSAVIERLLSACGCVSVRGSDQRLGGTVLEQKLTRYVVRSSEVEPKKFDWGEITWLDSAELTGSETLTVGIVTIHPGMSNPEHYHPNCDETLLLLEGELVHTIGDESFTLGPGDLIHIPIGVRHRAKNTGDVPAKMVVSYNTGRRQFVGE